MKKYKVKLKDEIKQLITESKEGVISYEHICIYYPKYFADVDVFTVIDCDDIRQVVVEPLQAHGLYIYRQHTTDFHNRFQFTIDNKVFE